MVCEVGVWCFVLISIIVLYGYVVVVGGCCWIDEDIELLLCMIYYCIKL